MYKAVNILDQIPLEPEQKDLLIQLAEAARNVPRDKREVFRYMPSQDGRNVNHPGLPDRSISVFKGDLDALANAGLISISKFYRHVGFSFNVSPNGFRYYEALKEAAGEPVDRVQEHIQTFLDTKRFQSKYAVAFQKWSEAESLLWQSDSEQQFTTIGHLCREAMQEFAHALVEEYEPANVDRSRANMSNTVERIRAVLNQRADELSGTVKPFLEALLPYWGTVSDLVQRQEHGAAKEGEALSWEDSRRVVFQTMVVMFEIDSALADL